MIKRKTIALQIIILLIVSFSNGITAQKRISREEYIQTYKDWAILDMKKSGIPASIKLAQACLESADGNSQLASKSNNHFGIKCHDNWNGKRAYHNDDARNECFRAYNNPLQSFEDHTIFLTTRSRYQKLFDLNPTNYKAWARGLKDAGYATNPQYPNLLIKIIEENELYLYDQEGGGASRNRKVSNKTQRSGVVINPFDVREVKYNNSVKYIDVKVGDTFDGLTQEFKLRDWEIAHYNDIPRNADIRQFRYLYMAPKRNKAHKNHNTHIVRSDETMHSISHQYGIKLKKLYSLNKMAQEVEPQIGGTLNLRKKVK